MPPGAAMGPRMVQAERNTAAVARRSVRECAQPPRGGQLQHGGAAGEEEVSCTVSGEGVASSSSAPGFRRRWGLQYRLHIILISNI